MDIGIIGTYKLPAREYLAKHKPTKIGVNAVGTWYEHPIYGDEAGLIMIPTGSDRIHTTGHMDVPSEEELGITFIGRA